MLVGEFVCGSRVHQRIDSSAQARANFGSNRTASLRYFCAREAQFAGSDAGSQSISQTTQIGIVSLRIVCRFGGDDLALPDP